MLREFEDRVFLDGRRHGLVGRIGAFFAWAVMAILTLGGLQTIGIL